MWRRIRHDYFKEILEKNGMTLRELYNKCRHEKMTMVFDDDDCLVTDEDLKTLDFVPGLDGGICFHHTPSEGLMITYFGAGSPEIEPIMGYP